MPQGVNRFQSFRIMVLVNPALVGRLFQNFSTLTKSIIWYMNTLKGFLNKDNSSTDLDFNYKLINIARDASDIFQFMGKFLSCENVSREERLNRWLAMRLTKRRFD